MYQENLPANCPLAKAQEQEIRLYRIIVNNSPGLTDFHCYAKLYPERKAYLTMCEAYGISLFDSKEVALSYMKRNPKLGNCVAKILIEKSHGKLLLTNKKTGHYNLWIYDSFDCSQLQVEIETIPHAQ